MNRIALRSRKTLVAGMILVLLLIVPVSASAQAGGVQGWIVDTGAHRIAGYVTLGLATTTAALGLFGSEYHWIAGASTAASATISLSLGSLAYRDQLDYYWPHAVLASLATAGFITNVFFLEGGSTAHVATGIASAATLYGAYGAILLLTW